MVGLLAVELFETADRASLVNELAMRPHNSGHWTIEGARTSQFEQHLRAVLDYPLGDTTLTAPVVVMANVLGGPAGGMSIDERLHHLFADDPGARVHLYGKQVRPGRKIGHVTVLGDDLADGTRPSRARGPLAAGRRRDGTGRRRHHGQRLGLVHDGARRATRWPSSRSPYEVGVVSAHRTPARWSTTPSRRPTAACR